MTDKSIIDGVDVAGCRYFTSEWDFNNCGHVCKGTECKYKRLWYKNQLSLKEQECESLKKQVDRTQMLLDTCNNNCEHYIQSLAEIKEIAKNGCYDEYGMPLDELSIILQKISKCLKEVKHD